MVKGKEKGSLFSSAVIVSLSPPLLFSEQEPGAAARGTRTQHSEPGFLAQTYHTHCVNHRRG